MASPKTLALALLSLLALLLLAGAPQARAADLGEKLEATEGKLEEVQERKGVLTSTISRYGDRIDELTASVAAIRTRQAKAHERLAVKQAELAQARAALSGAKRKLERARDHLQVALVALRRHLVAIYEAGSPDLLSVIVGADGIEDLAAQAEYLDRIRGQDEAVVGRVRDLRNEVRDLVVARLNSKVRIERARDYILGFADQLVANREALQSRQAELVDARGEREAALAQIGEHEDHLDSNLEAIQTEIVEQLRETGSAPVLAGPAGGETLGMIWPVEGPITSGFGGRDIGAGYEYHPGIDISVAEGTSIHAALSGTVVFTQSEAESGGYGNYTCIDHGGGLSTCYAHQSEFLVSPGQHVSQGQVIGLSGNTGYSTGPHLHFEVRIFGEVTDPLGYL
ncbi:MAG TPA: peptidoglycan DD-metalloendopeptidase family protein [Solirubrobacterales bacterium]|nr:peptidoglycan DD-metalloendopeptidase family protein [Solirubrobacterales bacterium]